MSRIIWSPSPSKILILISFVLLLPFANAQDQPEVLVPGQVPDCALQCPILLAAQQQCVPPYRATTNQATYNACFCNSDYLTTFKNGQTAGYCVGVCSQQEMRTILRWFQGTVCTSATATPVNNAATVAATAGTATGQATSTSTTTSSAASSNRSGKGPSW
jgi:hypothetical protein